jgi:hypothetical protein
MRNTRVKRRVARAFIVVSVLTVGACAKAPAVEPADVIITNGQVYSLTWPDPGPDGTPATDAPHDGSGWRPDAEAVAIRDGRIVYVGDRDGAERFRGAATQSIDVDGATVVPGLVDSHVHIRELGEAESQLDLTGVQTEEEAIERTVAYAARIPKGEWVLGRGWDEGAWAGRYPTWQQLNERVPDHPVVLDSLHGFATWGNRLAFERAGITRATKSPIGGEILRDAKGEPTGVLLNRAVELLESKIPPPTDEQLRKFVRAGLQRMARDGFTGVHEAGADSALMAAFEALEAAGELPVRVYAMISARDAELGRAWIARGPKTDPAGMLTVRSVKAYYDGALGSRGARLLEDYADLPGHRGVSGSNYGFDQALVKDLMSAGFQVGIHAIGDAGNRETLDFLADVAASNPGVTAQRNRIEHAQVVHPDDFARFASLQVIASMEPPHAVEDMLWAEARLGPERIKGAYAWRTMRRAGVRLVFNSDLVGSDHNIFYGLHSAITRRDKTLAPDGGWHADQRATPEEALRGYTTWAAYAGFAENDRGTLAVGRQADLTVMDVDPLALGATAPERLLAGRIRLTMVDGRVVYDGR